MLIHRKQYGQWQTGGYQILNSFFHRCTSAFAMPSSKSKLAKTVICITGSDVFKIMSQVLNAIVTRYQRLHGAESRLVQNLLTLQQFLTSTSRQLGGLSSHSLHENPLPSGETLTTATCSTGAAGRPRLSLNMEDISNFRSLGFSWSNISSLYGVSSRTLRRRRQESCVDVQSYDSITDADLDNIVGEILETTPQAGRNLVRGSLQSRGVHVQRRRIVEAIERVDPVTPTLRDNRQIVRRRYNVPCPNFLW